MSLIWRTFEFCAAASEYNWKPKTGRDFIALLYPRSLRTSYVAISNYSGKERSLEHKTKRMAGHYDSHEKNYRKKEGRQRAKATPLRRSNFRNLTSRNSVRRTRNPVAPLNVRLMGAHQGYTCTARPSAALIDRISREINPSRNYTWPQRTSVGSILMDRRSLADRSNFFSLTKPKSIDHFLASRRFH